MEAAGVLVVWVLEFVRCYAFLFVFAPLRGLLGQSGLLALSSALALGLLDVDSMSLVSSDALLLLGEFELAALVLSHTLVGAALGLALSIALECYSMAGRFVDVFRGAQFGEQLNPALGLRLSPLENLSSLLVLTAVFSLGGYQWAAALLYQAPAASFFGSAAGKGSTALIAGIRLENLLLLSQESINTAFALAAPVALFCFLLDLGACLLSRSLGRINVLFELLPLKLLLGLGAAVLSVQMLAPGDLVSAAIEFTRELVSVAGKT